MTPIGFILLIAGALAGGSIYFQVAPQFLADLPLSFMHWIGVAVLGAILVYFNRRPSD